MAPSFRQKFMTRLTLIVLLWLGFWWRLFLMLQLHPNTDEYSSMLAARAVQTSGLPFFPSGLFYTHGFLFSMLDGLYVGLLRIAGGGFLPEALQVPYRIPSLFLSMLAISLIYRVGQRWYATIAGLIAAGILALAPEAIFWGASVRMYSLAMVCSLLLAYVSYEAFFIAHSWRWSVLMGLTLIVTLLSHFLTVLVLPPLFVGLAVVGWYKGLWPKFAKKLVGWGLVAGFVVGGVALLQAMSLPPNTTPYSSTGAVSPALSLETVGNTIYRQINIFQDWPGIQTFLAQVIWEDRFNLFLFIAIAAGGGLLFVRDRYQARNSSRKKTLSSEQKLRLWFVAIVSIGPLLELAFLVDPYRRVPRYLVPFWPIVFLLMGAIAGLLISSLLTDSNGRRRESAGWLSVLIAIAVLLFFGFMARPGLARILYFNPAASERAFLFVKDHKEAGDLIVTPYTAAGGLYLGQVDYFAADLHARLALLNRGNQPVDRYWGAPWLKDSDHFQALLSSHPRVWFVVPEQVYLNYYRGKWHFVTQENMSLVWHEDGASVYLSHKTGVPLPDNPEHGVETTLNNQVQLQGYTAEAVGSGYRVFLFWKVLAPLPDDLTQFVHIRDQHGVTVAQADFRPLKGEYPTSQWKVGETVIDFVDIPIPPDLPQGEYQVLAGLYHWETLERLPVVEDTSGENAVKLEKIVW